MNYKLISTVDVPFLKLQTNTNNRTFAVETKRQVPRLKAVPIRLLRRDNQN